MAIRDRKFSVMTILVTIVCVAGFAIGLYLGTLIQDVRSRATNTGPTLAINPATNNLNVNETMTLGIMMDTHDDTVSATEIHITYDPTAIAILSFSPGTSLPVVLKPGAVANGNGSITLGVNPEHPLHGSAIIGSIQIKLLANKSSSISFTSETIVAALGKTTNALASTTGATITGTAPTSTPQPSLTLTQKPTSTPTHTPMPTPTMSPVQIASDFNADGKITIIDYTLFMTYWWTKNIPKADLNHDGKLSAIDYTILMNAWNESH